MEKEINNQDKKQDKNKKKKQYTLKELVSEITEDNIHKQYIYNDMGKEIN